MLLLMLLLAGQTTAASTQPAKPHVSAPKPAPPREPQKYVVKSYKGDVPKPVSTTRG
jgi:hypothetical protein